VVMPRVYYRQDACERFARKVAHGSGDECWEWQGAVRADGYGAFCVRTGNLSLAHRFGYELGRGPIAEGMTLDPLCRNRRCVRTDHLEAVTLAENKRRGMSANAINARKTHCDHGHEFSPTNTRIGQNGWRQCRMCKRLVDARARASRTPEQVQATRDYMRAYHLRRRQERPATLH